MISAASRQLGFSTNGFVRYSLPESIEVIARIGFGEVEILADRPHLFPDFNSTKQAEFIAKIIQKSGLSVSAINCNTVAGFYGRDFWEPLFEPSLANPERDARNWRIKYTLSCMDMAEILGAEVLVINSGRMNSGCPPEKGLQNLRRSLEVLLVEAEKRGLQLALEYEPGLLIERADEAMLLLHNFNSPNFGINLDVGHSWVAGEDPIFIIESFREKLFHVHLEDIKDRKHYHLIPGEGELPLLSILSALDRIHYTGSVTLELYTYPDQPEKAARAALQYLQQEKFHGLYRTTYSQRSSYHRRFLEHGNRRNSCHC
jgi:sugar phosphate isomerase/epimerase